MNMLYFIKINKTINADIFSQLLALVSSKRQEKISEFRFDIDQKLSLFSELIVRALICQTTNLKNDHIIFTENQYGKPYLIGHPNFHFNISHTRNAIAVVVSNKPIGVDIERIGEADIEIAKRFFTDNEFNYITALSESQNESFYKIWTKKEAYIISSCSDKVSDPFDVVELSQQDIINMAAKMGKQ